MIDPDSGDWLAGRMGSSLGKGIDLMSSIIGAQTDAELLSAVSAAASSCGFERVLIGTQWVGPRGERSFQVLSGYPLEWQAEYAQRGYMAIDPTVGHCQTSTTSLVWTQEQFEQANAMELFEEASGYGLSCGMSVPIHEVAGVKTMVSLVRDQPIDADPREQEQLVRAGEIIGNLAHFTFRRLITPQIQGVLPKRLTSNELTALRWVANGKTSWETSRIMNISEATVVFHLNNAMKKLDVVNRPQAIAAAFRLGLLE